MKKLILLTITISLSMNLHSQSKSALFIGNSYTNVNNLPQLINNCAKSVGDTLIYQAHTPGGAQLIQHASNPTVISLINSRNWDYMVLQEQSQKPSFGQASVTTNVYPYAKILCDTARANNQCTMPIFFMTWGRKYGDAGNCSVAPWLCTYNGMDSALSKSYREMGNLNNAYVSPVGAVWHYIIDNYPSINLYSSDNSHPSLAGSYAAACTFYSIFWQKDPSLITFNSTLSNREASDIRTAVKFICYDSLAKWNIGKFNPVANFTHNIFGRYVTFNNTSTKDSTYFWDFGDGNTSASKNPTHNYTADGTYIVTLISGNCFNDTIIDTLTILLSDLNESTISNSIKVFPNPSSGIFSIKGLTNIKSIILYSLDGNFIQKIKLNQNKINISNLNKGIYILKLQLEDSILTKKIILE